ncbi:MAG: hypothetical protein V4689_21865 [Verrucomicrobiota bacterium]
MKTLSLLSTFLVLGTLVAQAEPAAPARSTAQVTLRATDKTVRPEKEKKKDDGEKKEGPPKPETVTKSLDVAISAAKTIKGPLKIVISWYGRDATTKKQVMANKEEIEVTLDAGQNAKAATTFAYATTPAHSRKGPDGKDEKVPASGQTYTGWVVRAYEGAILVGESANSPTLLKLPAE